jgi:hypothetical protein
MATPYTLLQLLEGEMSSYFEEPAIILMKHSSYL